jgi:hypothetical protein
MVLAVLFILIEVALLAWPSSIYLWYDLHGMALPASRITMMAGLFASALLVALATFWTAMKRGVEALDRLG